jgi:hypothetical protein
MHLVDVKVIGSGVHPPKFKEERGEEEESKRDARHTV